MLQGAFHQRVSASTGASSEIRHMVKSGLDGNIAVIGYENV